MAEVSKYVLLDYENKVVNVILYDGESRYTALEGLTLDLPADGVSFNIGTYKQEDGLFYYKHSDGTFHLGQEVISSEEV
jgi:hypothetical protein